MRHQMTHAAALDGPENRLTGWALAPALLAAVAALAVWLLGANVTAFVQINAATAHWPAWLWSLVTDQASTLSAAALLALCVYRAPHIATAGLFSWPAGLVLVRGLKAWVDAPRPAATLPADSFQLIGTELTRYSFPSGHTATAFALAAAALYSVAPVVRRRWAAPLLAAAALVGVSRIAVGAHWPVDVLAGAALGWLCGLSGVLAATRWPLWRRPAAYRTLAGLALCAGALRVALESGYPDARGVAIVLGASACAAALVSLVRGTRA